MRFSGEVALVSGGTGALGHAVSLALARAGARVACTYIIPEEMAAVEEASRAEGLSIAGYGVDVTDPRQVSETVQAIERAWGRIDFLLNLTGGFAGGQHVEQVPIEEWDHMMALNLKSAFVCCRAVLPGMKANHSGRIVNVAARPALQRSAGLSAYATAKMGVVVLTETIALETRHEGITANCIVPSIIDTPVNRSAMPDADFTRWVKPEEIARVIVFLLSPEAAIISGAAIPVYGQA